MNRCVHMLWNNTSFCLYVTLFITVCCHRQGWCNNIAWNVGPLTWKQFVLSAERYEYNKLQLCKSLVPMVQLSWNLARNVHVTDPKLYDLVKTCLCHSLRHSRVVIDYAHSLGKEVKFYGHAENEAAHYCSNCEVGVTRNDVTWKFCV